MTPRFPQLLRNPVHLLAFGLGSGLSPVAPGTAGTLLAAVVFWLLSPLDFLPHLVLVLAAIGFGIYICGRTSRDLGEHDLSTCRRAHRACSRSGWNESPGRVAAVQGPGGGNTRRENVNRDETLTLRVLGCGGGTAPGTSVSSSAVPSWLLSPSSRSP